MGSSFEDLEGLENIAYNERCGGVNEKNTR